MDTVSGHISLSAYEQVATSRFMCKDHQKQPDETRKGHPPLSSVPHDGAHSTAREDFSGKKGRDLQGGGMQGDGMGKGRGTPPPWPEVIFFVNLRGQGGSPFTFQPYDSSTATMQSSKDGSSFKLSVFFYGRPPHAGSPRAPRI